ncbi:hypothetical protein L0F63_006174, partial [Massospora cicadina]
ESYFVSDGRFLRSILYPVLLPALRDFEPAASLFRAGRFGQGVAAPEKIFKRANASLMIDARLIVKAGGRFYQQPFGLVRGDWLKGSTKPEATVHGLEEQSPDLAWRRAGVMHLDLKRDLTDAPAMNATFGFVYGRLSLYSDIALNESKSLLLEGLHVVSNGSIYLHGYSSASEYDPSNLLGILPRRTFFSKAKEGLERHLNQSLGLFENMTDPSLNASCWVRMVAQLMRSPPNIPARRFWRWG